MALLQVRDQVLLAGLAISSGAVDNATATATATPAATGGKEGQFTLFGFTAFFSATVSAFKSVTLSYTEPGGTARSIVFPWDFTAGALVVAFPGPITCQRGSVATAALTASGTGGTTGTVVLYAEEF